LSDASFSQAAHTEGMSSTEFDLVGYSKALAGVIEQASQSVVAVKSAAYHVTSGVAFRENLIAVSNHTLRREGSIPVHLPDGGEAEASILGRDPSIDLALLLLRDKTVPVLEIESDAELRAGALAIVVGRTLDAGLSASLGILGAVADHRRTWRGGGLDKFLRLDVNFYPSQTGAAVVSATGKFIGMATPAMLRHSSLAIPPKTLNRVADELLREGRVRRGYLGVGLQLVAIPKHLQSKAPVAGEVGLMVLSIEPETGAEQAGLQLGDILLAANGTALSALEILMNELTGEVVGKTVKLTLLRAGNVIELQVPVSERGGKRN
jgi:S1-C subfamily serine protease